MTLTRGFWLADTSSAFSARAPIQSSTELSFTRARVPWPPGMIKRSIGGASANVCLGTTVSPLRARIGSGLSATVKTSKAPGAICRPATEKTSNGPQKSRTSTSGKMKMATLRVGGMGNRIVSLA